MPYPSTFNPTQKNTESFLSTRTDKNPYMTNDSVGSLFIPNCESRQLQTQRLKDYWENFVANYGVRIEYWNNAYDLKKHDFLYGEHTTAGFNPERLLKAYVEITEESRILSKFGIMTDNDATLYVTIKEFQRVWGATVPKIGDVWRVMDGACDRPEQQTPKVFQISDKIDTINPVDFLGGHYVWKLTSRRFDFSYEDNAPNEGNGGLSDVPFFGQIFPEDTTTENKPYPNESDNVDDKAKEDYDNNADPQKSYPYGNYL